MAEFQQKAEVFSIKDLPADHRKKIAQVTGQVRVNWKRTVGSILCVGKGLEQLKGLMPYKLYLNHIRVEFGLNEAQGWRLVSVWQKFGNSKSTKVLEAKISALYLLSTAPDLKKVETLASGGKVLIGGKKKGIEEITVAEATKLRKSNGSFQEPSLAEQDREQAESAHRHLCTLAEEVADWCGDIERIKKRGLEIKNVEMVKDYLREVAHAASSVAKLL
jgi:hypothetical protein